MFSNSSEDVRWLKFNFHYLKLLICIRIFTNYEVFWFIVVVVFVDEKSWFPSKPVGCRLCVVKQGESCGLVQWEKIYFHEVTVLLLLEEKVWNPQSRRRRHPLEFLVEWTERCEKHLRWWILMLLHHWGKKINDAIFKYLHIGIYIKMSATYVKWLNL